MKDKKDIDIKDVLPNTEDEFKEESPSNKAIELLTSRESGKLDLLTDINESQIVAIVKRRIFKYIYYSDDEMETILDNLDNDILALLVSLKRGGRRDIKDVTGFNVLEKMMSGDMTDTIATKGITQRTLERVGVKRD